MIEGLGPSITFWYVGILEMPLNFREVTSKE